MENKEKRTPRREKIGVVLSDKMQKTVIVNVERTFPHPEYDKVVTRVKKYYAHDESDSLEAGDRVLIKECRPYSKTKKWCVVKKLEGKN